MRASFALLLLVGCAGNVANPCPVGALGCDCTQGGGCDPGLVCGPNRSCASPERIDAGQTDSGTPDAGMSGAMLWNKSSGGGAGKTALFDTVSRAVEFVQHRPVTAVGDTFTNALGRTVTVDRPAGTVVFQ